jgi:hypothetical protein
MGAPAAARPASPQARNDAFGERSMKPVQQDDGSLLVPLSDDQIKVVAGERKVVGALEGARLSHLVGGGVEVQSAPYYVFGIGNGITNADYLKARAQTGYGGTEPKFPPHNFFEATYSSRLAGAPESLWTTNAEWLQTGGLLDNEQTEVHYYWQPTDYYDYHVDVEYQVSSEANYDYIWINSTSSDWRVCNSPGVVRTKQSGEKSDTVSFDIPADCRTMWLGIYYIKDYSVAGGNDFARIKNVRIYAKMPVGL